MEDWVKEVNGLRSTNWQLQNSHGDVKYSIENIVSNVVITVWGVQWLLMGDHFLSYVNV